ncbi:MAG: hypothetical protein ACK54T_08390 [bacterium]|jgi:hypothetical protein
MSDPAPNNAAASADHASNTTSHPANKSTFVPFAGGLALGVIVGALAGAFVAPLISSKMENTTRPTKATGGQASNTAPVFTGQENNPETAARNATGTTTAPTTAPTPAPAPAPSPKP